MRNLRIGKLERKTKETDIKVYLDLDKEGDCQIETGIGFFDHMLDALSRHWGVSLKLTCKGDLAVDCHHTIEDVGICLGKALKIALGDKPNKRFGSASIPMDEALSVVSLDISGRPFLVFKCDFSYQMMGEMETAMVEEFLRSFAFNAGITLHASCLYGSNDHHKAESIFKALAYALKEACLELGESEAIRTTKGSLD